MEYIHKSRYTTDINFELFLTLLMAITYGTRILYFLLSFLFVMCILRRDANFFTHRYSGPKWWRRMKLVKCETKMRVNNSTIIHFMKSKKLLQKLRFIWKMKKRKEGKWNEKRGVRPRVEGLTSLNSTSTDNPPHKVMYCTWFVMDVNAHCDVSTQKFKLSIWLSKDEMRW